MSGLRTRIYSPLGQARQNLLMASVHFFHSRLHDKVLPPPRWDPGCFQGELCGERASWNPSGECLGLQNMWEVTGTKAEKKPLPTSKGSLVTSVFTPNSWVTRSIRPGFVRVSIAVMEHRDRSNRPRDCSPASALLLWITLGPSIQAL